MAGIQGSTKVVTATIKAGASTSQVLNLSGQVLVGIIVPAAWSAAAISFLTSADGVTFVALYDTTGAVVQTVVTVSTQIQLQPADLAGIRYLKIQSGIPGATVNQAADRALQLITRSVQ